MKALFWNSGTAQTRGGRNVEAEFMILCLVSKVGRPELRSWRTTKVMKIYDPDDKKPQMPCKSLDLTLLEKEGTFWKKK
jgi:hypothetical protein